MILSNLNEAKNFLFFTSINPRTSSKIWLLYSGLLFFKIKKIIPHFIFNHFKDQSNLQVFIFKSRINDIKLFGTQEE